jgi:sulfite reductase beta subunit-like hemoprotein
MTDVVVASHDMNAQALLQGSVELIQDVRQEGLFQPAYACKSAFFCELGTAASERRIQTMSIMKT